MSESFVFVSTHGSDNLSRSIVPQAHQFVSYNRMPLLLVMMPSWCVRTIPLNFRRGKL